MVETVRVYSTPLILFHSILLIILFVCWLVYVLLFVFSLPLYLLPSYLAPLQTAHLLTLNLFLKYNCTLWFCFWVLEQIKKTEKMEQSFVVIHMSVFVQYLKVYTPRYKMEISIHTSILRDPNYFSDQTLHIKHRVIKVLGRQKSIDCKCCVCRDFVSFPNNHPMTFLSFYFERTVLFFNTCRYIRMILIEGRLLVMEFENYLKNKSF